MPVFNNKQDSFSGLPFGSFLSLLAAEGFAISIRDITEFTAVFNDLIASFDSQPVPAVNADQREDLKLYLAPLICRNEAEQTKFYQLFDDFFVARKIGDPPPEIRKRWKGKRRLIVSCGVIVLAAVGLLIWWLLPRDIELGSVSISLITSHDSAWVNTPIVFSSAFSQPLKEAPTWSFGDGTPNQKGLRVSHLYRQTGEYRVRVIGAWRDHIHQPDSSSATVVVYPFPAAVLVPLDSSELIIGDTLKVLARLLDTGYRKGIAHWVVGNLNNSEPSTSLPFADTIFRYVCRETGVFTVSLLSQYNVAGPSMSFMVSAPDDASLTVSPIGKPFATTYKPAVWWIIGLLGLFLLATAAVLYARKHRKKVVTLPNLPGEEFPGMTPPTEIPMNSRNSRIVRLQAQSKTAALLQQRIESDVLYLNIPRTIRKSIVHLGYPFPEYSNRYKDRDYLILIDAGDTAGSQYIPLFSYLVKTFVADNVDLSYYYYNRDPTLLYREKNRTPVYLNDIRDRHYGATLLVFSNGNNLLDPVLPTVAAPVRNSFDAWSHRILITPAPALDWSAHEEILADYFNLVPADIIGLLNIVKFLNEDLPGSISFKTQDWKTYRSKYADVQDLEGLKNYLNDPDLFQWVCALSVYHKVRWEVIIEMGKSILAASDAAGKLHYTNLLRIARIRWIEEGAFPETVRLELLKQLSIDNELIARRAMLGILSESDSEIDSNHFSYEEKMIQRYTDSFILFANDPVKGVAYREDAGKFLNLWQGDRIADSTLYAYLKNPDHRWETPLNAPGGGKHRNVNVNEFIEQNVRWRRHPLFYPGLAVACLSLILLAALIWFGGDLQSSPLNKYLRFEAAEPLTNARISIFYSSDSCAHKLMEDLPLRIWLENGNVQMPAFEITKTSNGEVWGKVFNLGNLPANYSGLNLVLHVANTRRSLSARLPPDPLSTSYAFSLSGPLCNQRPPPSSSALVYIQYDPKLDSQTVEQLRQCVTAAGFYSPDMEAIRRPLPTGNVIRYFDTSMRIAAQQLLQTINNCYKFNIHLEKPELRSKTKQLEVWINNLGGGGAVAGGGGANGASPCQTVNLNQISGLRQNITYCSDNMKTSFELSPPYLYYSPATSQNASYKVNSHLRYCGGQYSLYLWSSYVIGNPDTWYGDSLIFTLNNNDVQFKKPYNDLPAGNYSVIFDLKNYKIAQGASPADLGDWKQVATTIAYHITADSFFTTASSYASAYRILSRWDDATGKNRVYELQSQVNFATCVIRETPAGKYIFVSTTASKLTTHDIALGVATVTDFQKIVPVRQSNPTIQAQSVAPTPGRQVLWITDDPSSPYNAVTQNDTFRKLGVRFIKSDFSSTTGRATDSVVAIVIVPQLESNKAMNGAETIKVDQSIQYFSNNPRSKIFVCGGVAYHAYADKVAGYPATPTELLIDLLAAINQENAQKK